MARSSIAAVGIALAACGGRSPADKAHSDLQVEGAKITVENARNFRLTLRDGEGQPIRYEPVSWTVSGGENHIIPLADRTDADGVAQAWFSSKVAEEKTVTVDSGGVQLSTGFLVTAGQPGIYSSLEVRPLHAPADGVTPMTIIVHARDLYANVVPGVPVQIFIYGGDIRVLSPAAAQTGSNGTVVARIAGMVPAQIVIVAQIGRIALRRTASFG